MLHTRHLLLTIFMVTPIFAQTTVDELDATRGTIEKWVETRRIISEEKRDWALDKELLQERIELVKREIESIRGRIYEAKKSITEADKNRQALVDQNEKLKSASAALRKTVDGLEDRTKALLVKLPDPIQSKVKPLSQRLPADQTETKASLSERFQNVVGITNAVNKFNRDITMTTEKQALPDGTSAEVTVLYIGLGQGYYVSGNGKIAGVGTASESGWQWRPANDAAEEIARAISIIKNESIVDFVILPVEIK